MLRCTLLYNAILCSAAPHYPEVLSDDVRSDKSAQKWRKKVGPVYTAIQYDDDRDPACVYRINQSNGSDFEDQIRSDLDIVNIIRYLLIPQCSSPCVTSSVKLDIPDILDAWSCPLPWILSQIWSVAIISLMAILFTCLFVIFLDQMLGDLSLSYHMTSLYTLL